MGGCAADCSVARDEGSATSRSQIPSKSLSGFERRSFSSSEKSRTSRVREEEAKDETQLQATRVCNAIIEECNWTACRFPFSQEYIHCTQDEGRLRHAGTHSNDWG